MTQDDLHSLMPAKKSTVTRENLARAVKRSTGLPISKSLKLVECVFESIIRLLDKERCVKLRRFGTFRTKRKASRTGRNPKNLVEVVIPKRTVVRFSIAPTFKAIINDNINLIG